MWNGTKNKISYVFILIVIILAVATVEWIYDDTGNMLSKISYSTLGKMIDKVECVYETFEMKKIIDILNDSIEKLSGSK